MNDQISSFQVSLVNIDKNSNICRFQPASLSKLPLAQREYLTVTITDDRLNLFFEAMRHSPSVFLHSCGLITVRFDLECHCEQTVSDGDFPSKTSVLTPIFPEDYKLFSEARLIRSVFDTNKHRFELGFTCTYTSQYYYPEGVSSK